MLANSRHVKLILAMAYHFLAAEDAHSRLRAVPKSAGPLAERPAHGY